MPISPNLAFEAVSIRNSAPDSVGYFHPTGDGFRAGKSTLRLLIETAYLLQDYQLQGGPSWIGSVDFDVVATAGRAISTAELRPMLQNMLADRFRLVMHKEPEKLSGYTLVVAKGGPKLREATGEKPELYWDGAQIEARHTSFSQLVDILRFVARRLVVDRTGIQGVWDFTLEWTRGNGQAAVPGADPAALPQPQGPSIFVAIEEQLGLKLESLPGDLWVIDRVERPSES